MPPRRLPVGECQRKCKMLDAIAERKAAGFSDDDFDDDAAAAPAIREERSRPRVLVLGKDCLIHRRRWRQ